MGVVTIRLGSVETVLLVKLIYYHLTKRDTVHVKLKGCCHIALMTRMAAILRARTGSLSIPSSATRSTSRFSLCKVVSCDAQSTPSAADSVDSSSVAPRQRTLADNGSTQLQNATAELQKILTTLEEIGRSRQHATLGEPSMDATSLGKPGLCTNNVDKFPKWTRHLGNLVGVFGDEFRLLVEWAASDEYISKKDADDALGEESEHVDLVAEVHRRCRPRHHRLAAPTQRARQGIEVSAGVDSGAEDGDTPHVDGVQSSQKPNIAAEKDH